MTVTRGVLADAAGCGRRSAAGRPARCGTPTAHAGVIPLASDTAASKAGEVIHAVRLWRPDGAYADAADPPGPMAAGHRKQGTLALLDLACAHAQAEGIEEGLRVAATTIDLAHPHHQNHRRRGRARP